MTYRSDEELAKQRRDEVVKQYQDSTEGLLASAGGDYSRRVGLRVFAFLSPLLLLLIPAMTYQDQRADFDLQKSSALVGQSILVVFGSLLILWLLSNVAELLASLRLRQSLRRYVTPTEDVYRDLARLAETPADRLRRHLASVDYAVPLLLLVLVLPAVVYTGQYLMGFVPFSPIRSQEGLRVMSLSFLLCAIAVHLCLLFVSAQLLRKTKTRGSFSYQMYRPFFLCGILLLTAFEMQRYLSWSNSGLSSLHERQEIEALYSINGGLFLGFVFLFELVICFIIKKQANLTLKTSDKLPQ